MELTRGYDDGVAEMYPSLEVYADGEDDALILRGHESGPGHAEDWQCS